MLEIKTRRGVLSLEFSRGCSHSACTFCPRNHKGKEWRYMKPKQMYNFSEKLYYICKKEGMNTRIYAADEEFVGYINGTEENRRIIEYFSLLKQNNIKIIIDISCRVDSIYSPKLGDNFNIDKILMWQFCSKYGLGRVFIGVESFCDNQLIRYNKGTTSNQNIIAIKILTSLGIDIRLGILLFDQLMTSVSEIVENIDVLGRKDIIQKPCGDKLKCDELYYKIIEGKNNQSGVPLYMKTSYLLTNMEVLKDSLYFDLCKKRGLCLKENKNWGKYDVPFINKNIDIMSIYLIKWVSINYPITYAIKTLLKSSSYDEYEGLSQVLNYYKFLNYSLLRYFLKYIDDFGMVENNVVSFSKYIQQCFRKDDIFFIEDINYFFKCALLKAKELFECKLMDLEYILKNDKPDVKEKIIQLTEQYKTGSHIEF